MGLNAQNAEWKHSLKTQIILARQKMVIQRWKQNVQCAEKRNRNARVSKRENRTSQSSPFFILFRRRRACSLKR